MGEELTQEFFPMPRDGDTLAAEFFELVSRQINAPDLAASFTVESQDEGSVVQANPNPEENKTIIVRSNHSREVNNKTCRRCGGSGAVRCWDCGGRGCRRCGDGYRSCPVCWGSVR